MGATRAGSRRTSDLVILGFVVLGIAAYLLMPNSNPWVADVVIGIAAFVVLIALFVRLLG